jgi:hypothetical protein
MILDVLTIICPMGKLMLIIIVLFPQQILVKIIY